MLIPILWVAGVRLSIRASESPATHSQVCMRGARANGPREVVFLATDPLSGDQSRHAPSMARDWFDGKRGKTHHTTHPLLLSSPSPEVEERGFRKQLGKLAPQNIQPPAAGAKPSVL